MSATVARPGAKKLSRSRRHMQMQDHRTTRENSSARWPERSPEERGNRRKSCCALVCGKLVAQIPKRSPGRHHPERSVPVARPARSAVDATATTLRGFNHGRHPAAPASSHAAFFQDRSDSGISGTGPRAATRTNRAGRARGHHGVVLERALVLGTHMPVSPRF